MSKTYKDMKLRYRKKRDTQHKLREYHNHTNGICELDPDYEPEKYHSIVNCPRTEEVTVVCEHNIHTVPETPEQMAYSYPSKTVLVARVVSGEPASHDLALCPLNDRPHLYRDGYYYEDQSRYSTKTKYVHTYKRVKHRHDECETPDLMTHYHNNKHRCRVILPGGTYRHTKKDCWWCAENNTRKNTEGLDPSPRRDKQKSIAEQIADADITITS